MDSFENMSYMFAEFWTPVRQRNERVKLKVPKWDKCRSKSDSNSPFPDIYFDTQTRKFTKVSENAFQRERQENSVGRSASRPRTPLQVLNKSVDVTKANVQKTTPRICISEHFTKTESLNVNLCAERTPASSRSRNLSSWSSSYTPRSTLINKPIGNKTNIKKKFIIYDENCATTSKENNEQSSSSNNLIQDLNLVNNYFDENSQQKFVLSSYEGKNKENVNNCASTPCKTQSLCQSQRSDRKMTSTTMNTDGPDTLPLVEKIGAPFWGADERSFEDLSLEDIFRSANIWDIKENYNYHCCSNGTDSLFESCPEFQMMQEPSLLMDLEPTTIEVPWNEI
ncbi:Protein of unknown function [Gryllus bimaculatus]|nr:Protein of unknown function [Gryllus bimaculatus]